MENHDLPETFITDEGEVIELGEVRRRFEEACDEQPGWDASDWGAFEDYVQRRIDDGIIAPQPDV